MNNKLRKVIDYLLLHSPYMHDIGLFHGKMGVVVALYMYAEAFHDEFISEYAWELFQHIYDGIYSNMPIGLEYGLSGIGYGTTFMYRRGLVDCDLNSVLAEVDSKIMEYDPRRMKDLSIRSGVGGLMRYIALRQSIGEPIETFDGQYLTELYTIAAGITTCCNENDIMSILNAPPFPIEKYTEKPLGIDGGSAYYILKNTLK